MPRIAIIITTYNWPAALEAVLTGYLSQSRPPDELIIADDGSTDETREVLEQKIPVSNWTWSDWLQARRRKQINRLLPLFQIPLGTRYRRRLARQWEGAKTCNLSAWKQDLLAVNGFDEDYTGWGMEDSDLVLRLIRNGIYHKDARFAAAVYHIWHRENSRDQLEENQRRLQQLIETDRIQARIGIEQAQSA